MLLSLNDYCLENICRFLKITDQTALAFTCERLNDVLVERLWKRDSKECYMSAIASKVERIQLIKLQMNTLNVLSGCTFPKVVSLHLNELNTLVYAPHLRPDIADIFPKLEKLTLNSPNVTGKNLWKLDALKDLDLSNCAHLNPQYFSQILSCLQLRTFNINTELNGCDNAELVVEIPQCKSLEALTIRDMDSIFIAVHLKAMSQLRQIKMYLCDENVSLLLPGIASIAGWKINAILFNNAFRAYKSNMFCILCMELERFILHDDKISVNQLIKIGEELGNSLLEVRLIASLPEGFEGFLAFLEYCTSLDILDISRNPIDVKCLTNAIAVLGRRTKPLSIRCYETAITTEDLKCLELPNFVEVSIEKDIFILPEASYIQCEWEVESMDE